MRQRGRRSRASLQVLRVDGSPERLQPPSNLTASERKLFCELVDAVPAKHFAKSDAPLLVSYVRCVLLSQKASKKAGTDASALMVFEKCTRLMSTLSVRLRLSPSARLDRAAVQRQREREPIGPPPWSVER
jgi:hypothetical protein